MNNPSWRHWLKERRGLTSSAFIYLWCPVHMLTNLVVNMFSLHWTQCKNPKSTSLCSIFPKDHRRIRHYTHLLDRRLLLVVVIVVHLFMTANHTECENCLFLLLCCKKSFETVKFNDNFTLPYLKKKKKHEKEKQFPGKILLRLSEKQHVL